jgi:hypothetical protein
MKFRIVESLEQEALQFDMPEDFVKSFPKVYHGTNTEFRKFNPKKGAQGTIWFTNDKDTIIRGESGAQGTKYVMERYLTGKNWAGWNEYDKYMIVQLIQMGYDGVKLPAGEHNDYMLFDNKNIYTEKELINLWKKVRNGI